jgi:hypothetical protein
LEEKDTKICIFVGENRAAGETNVTGKDFTESRWKKEVEEFLDCRKENYI